MKASSVVRRKLEEWTDEAEPKTLRLDVKPGEEVLLQHLIRFCYSRQVDLTEGRDPPMLHCCFTKWFQQPCALALGSDLLTYFVFPASMLDSDCRQYVNAEKPLLRLMQLADRFLMPDCVDICAASLAPKVSCCP